MTLPDDADVWVLAGQSNMQGCGLLQNALPPDERVHCFSSAGAWEPGEEPLHRLWESFTPVHQAFMRPSLPEERRHLSNAEMAEIDRRENPAGAGLGLAFGRAMSDATQRPTGLVPAAHGGTTLEQWSQQRKNEGGHSLYGAMLERIRRAGGQLRGVLWYQGESDATAQDAPTYAERFDAWIAALRADLQQPALPVIAVQIGCVAQCGNGVWQAHSWELIREALATLPDRTPHTAVTSAVDLGLDDTIHIHTAGLIRLGRRLARLALHLTESGYPNGPRLEHIERVEEARGYGAAQIVCSGVSEGWEPRQHISGFETRTPEGEPHPSFCVLNARADADDPTRIRVLLNAPPDDSCRLGYGLGLNPFCNAVDAADMPLPAFAPRLTVDS
jgi:sialate O-acetylesterase